MIAVWLVYRTSAPDYTHFTLLSSDIYALTRHHLARLFSKCIIATNDSLYTFLAPHYHMSNVLYNLNPWDLTVKHQDSSWIASRGSCFLGTVVCRTVTSTLKTLEAAQWFTPEEYNKCRCYRGYSHSRDANMTWAVRLLSANWVPDPAPSRR
jgi:hypothetical protein